MYDARLRLAWLCLGDGEKQGGSQDRRRQKKGKNAQYFHLSIVMRIFIVPCRICRCSRSVCPFAALFMEKKVQNMV